MRVRLVASSESREHLAQRDVRRIRVVEREARFEVRLRLAPELLPLAQDAERVQQRLVPRELAQRALEEEQTAAALSPFIDSVEYRPGVS